MWAEETIAFLLNLSFPIMKILTLIQTPANFAAEALIQSHGQ